MKLRQKSKRDQALDAVASVAKTWSEWRLGEKVSKTASKATKKTSRAQKKSKARKGSRSDGGRRKPVKILAALGIVGGIGAAAAKKLTGGKAEPLYTPPAPAQETPPPDAGGAPGEPASDVVPGAGESAGATPLAEDAAVAPPGEDDPASSDLVAPADLVSDTATEGEDAGESGEDPGDRST